MACAPKTNLWNVANTVSYFREYWRCSHCFAACLSVHTVKWPTLAQQDREPDWLRLMLAFPEVHANCTGGRFHVVGLYIYTSLDQPLETPTVKLT